MQTLRLCCLSWAPLQVVAGTSKHKVRLYDARHGRRPALDISFGETRITALAPEADGMLVCSHPVLRLPPAQDISAMDTSRDGRYKCMDIMLQTPLTQRGNFDFLESWCDGQSRMLQVVERG